MQILHNKNISSDRDYVLIHEYYDLRAPYCVLIYSYYYFYEYDSSCPLPIRGRHKYAWEPRHYVKSNPAPWGDRS